MTDSATPTASVAPIAVSTSNAAPAQMPAVATPEFVGIRVDRAKKAVLKELGVKVKKSDDPNAKLAEFKTGLEAEKGKRKEMKAKIEEQAATIARLSQSEAAVKVFADMEFSALTPAQQDMVKTLAGEDPNERIKVISQMKALQPTAVPVAAPVTAAPIPTPAQTAPANGSPEAATSSIVDPKTEYARLAADPRTSLVAAAYLLQNRRLMYPDHK